MGMKYLCTVPDSVTMTREVFSDVIRKFRHHRAIKFGFSRKHTSDIMAYRKQSGISSDSTIPSNLYNLPVTYNTDVTYVE